MQITRKDLNPCTVELAVVCEAAEVHQGFEAAYKQLTKKLKMPGFRPGHAPRAMVEPLLEEKEWGDKAVESIVRDLYKPILDKEELAPEPTLRPVVEVKKIERAEEACEFNLKVYLPPQVTLGEYKGLSVEAPDAAVSDEEVELQIDELRKRKSTQVSVTDRGIQEGDVCVVNIKLPDQTGDGRNFMSVVGQTFPDLDEALKGMRAEEMKKLKLNFPKTFQEKDWAGNELEAQVTVNSVSMMSLPELDETFAQSLKLENVDDLKVRIRELLTEAKEEAVKELTTERLLDALLERSKVEVPDGMWETLAERRLIETAQEQREAGKNMEEYAKDNGMTLESMIDAWKDKAKVHVVRALLIREVFTKEEMKLTTEDLNVELLAMSREYGAEPAAVLNELRKSNSLEELHFRAISRRVSTFLIEHSSKKEPAGARS